MPYKLLENEKIQANGQDLETFIRYWFPNNAFGGGTIERRDLDQTGMRFVLEVFYKYRPFTDSRPLPSLWGTIEILEWSNDRSQIMRMYAKRPDDWEIEFLRSWEGRDQDEVIQKRYENLEKLGAAILAEFGEFVEEKPKETQKQTAKGGRPHYTEDLWAHDQIFSLDRSPDEVKPEWLERVKENPNRSETLSASLKKHWDERITNPKWP